MFTANFLSQAKINLGEKIKIEISNKNDQISGVFVNLQSGSKVNNYLISVDRQISKGDMTYFVMCYYNSIERALKEKIVEIQYGGGQLRLKKVRGCSILSSYDFVRHSNPIINLFLRIWQPLHYNWMKRKKDYHTNV